MRRSAKLSMIDGVLTVDKVEVRVLNGQIFGMIATVGAALVALFSAAYSVRLTTRTSREVEVLKADLAREAAADKSRRDYEYEARKRIYAECEPLVIRLAESCDYAAARIISLTDERRWGELRATRDPNRYWMLTKSSEVISTAHALLEPLSLFALLSEKVTLVDLGFDQRLAEIYTLARAAYQTHLDDYQIAAIGQPLDYDPVVPGWRAKRAVDPAKYWWQGLTRVRLDPAVELCIHRDAGRVTTISEFEERYITLFDAVEDSRNKSLGLFCNPLYNFTPESRPVYWRLLMCQLLIYRRIANRSRLQTVVPVTSTFDFTRSDIDALQRTPGVSDSQLDSSIEAALIYTSSILG
ncbi:hypothetical protein [Amycolatopsis sp. NPDC051371]|uniref:hypothetical protein n=1 Tax=Amycolatopsis sp. NPDC051371 TaxID=3155800 RepID=UPI003445485C